MRRSFVLVLVAALAGCGKEPARSDPTPVRHTVAAPDALVDRCPEGCRQYFTLHWDKETRQLLETTPPGEQAALQRQRDADYRARLDDGLPRCIDKCRSNGAFARAQCWVDARSTGEAKACP
jgi:hypothetical protein